MSKDGGPAFPQTHDSWYRADAANRDLPAPSGMTLRDWFAGQALVGLLTIHAKSEHSLAYDDFGSTAYLLADAMLKARRNE